MRGPLFLVKVRPNERRKTYRAAIVVGRKVNKSAVTRNRIRRRLYEAVRLNQEVIGTPCDIVVNVFSDEVATEPFETITRQMRRQLKQATAVGDHQP